MDKSAGENTQSLGERIGNAFRRVEPNSTAKNISRKAQIPFRTVERWLDGTSTPSLEHYEALVKAYPRLLLVLAMPWIRDVVTILEHDALAEHLATQAGKRQRAVNALRGRR